MPLYMRAPNTCLLLLLAFPAGCNGPVRDLYPPKQGQPTRTVHVYNNHWHTGVVLKLADLSDDQRRLFQRFETSPYVEVGWGDDEYYRAEKTTLGNTLQAVCVPSSSVLHIAAVDVPPERHYTRYEAELYRIELSRAGFDCLADFVTDTFATDEQGGAIYLQPGLCANSGFYRARGSYCGCRMCNHWTAQALRAAGLPITPVWAMTADNVARQLRRINQVRQISVQ